jgi:hypothetical protein
MILNLARGSLFRAPFSFPYPPDRLKHSRNWQGFFRPLRMVCCSMTFRRWPWAVSVDSDLPHQFQEIDRLDGDVKSKASDEDDSDTTTGKGTRLKTILTQPALVSHQCGWSSAAGFGSRRSFAVAASVPSIDRPSIRGAFEHRIIHGMQWHEQKAVPFPTSGTDHDFSRLYHNAKGLSDGHHHDSPEFPPLNRTKGLDLDTLLSSGQLLRDRC